MLLFYDAYCRPRFHVHNVQCTYIYATCSYSTRMCMRTHTRTLNMHIHTQRKVTRALCKCIPTHLQLATCARSRTFRMYYTSASSRRFFLRKESNWWKTPPESPVLRIYGMVERKVELITGTEKFWVTVSVEKCLIRFIHSTSFCPAHTS